MGLTIDATATQYVTLDELKTHLNITSSRDDAELFMTLSAAVDAVEGIVGPILHRTVTEQVAARCGVVVLGQYPVVSVTSLLSNETPVEYVLDVESGLLSDVTQYGASTVTYVAGRTVVPDAIRLATLIVAGHLWQIQKGAASPSGGLQGDDELTITPGVGYAIPSRAQDLLTPYATAPTVA